MATETSLAPRPALAPGIVLGIGFGGFLDGIVMHELLEWHHLVDDSTIADAVFHALTVAVALLGSLLVVRAWRQGRLAPPWLAHAGALVIGWGIFNLLDSLNHFVFGLHHIRDDLGGPLGWDLGFLAFAALLVAAGQAMTRAALKRPGSSRPPEPRTPRGPPAP